jgi:2,5-diamino-6-(ribosylamino)-4(3H)-pyrimidinone 5'-phosphate reductase
LQNAVSADGRLDWFKIDLGLYYELASGYNVDAHLAGSNTILDTKEEIPKEDEDAFLPSDIDPNDKRTYLVVPDSKGRVRHWHFLKKAPFWKGFIALCSRSTPKDYLDYLGKRHIEHIIAGEDHVDMREALEKLNSDYGVESVLLDSGGTLNGILLRAGLVDEINLLIHPNLVGGISPSSCFNSDDLKSEEGVIDLKLINMKKVKDNIIWLKYEVIK